MKNQTQQTSDTTTQVKNLHYFRPSDGRKKREQQNPWIVTVGGKEVARFADQRAAYEHLKSLPHPHDPNHRNLLASMGADGWAWLDFLEDTPPRASVMDELDHSLPGDYE